MKIKLFKKSFSYRDVSFFVLTEIDIPLSYVMSNRIFSGCIIGMDHFLYESIIYKHDYNIIDDSRALDEIYKNYIEIPLKINNKRYIKKGIIFYKNIENLADFFKKFIDFTYDCPFINAMKEYCEIRKKINFDLFIEKLNYDSYYKWNKTNIIMSVLVRGEKYTEKQYTFYFDNKNTYLFLKTIEDTNQNIICINKFMEIDKYKIPYVEYIYYDFSIDKHINCNCVAYVDGELRTYNDISDINPLILHKFDKEGKLYNKTFVDLLPDTSKEVFAILRIPTKKEYKEKVKRNNNNILKNDILDKVFYISPSLKPAKINSNIKVIDDIYIFEEIISKMVSNIYIPDNLKSDFDPYLLPDKEQFLYLERPV
ncbi:MAG: hypothetical protein N3E50_09240 [Candidatus Goldbacteria bacterium]|nr:hypothetical protein [Candidatus Goldiibacteriota bacterium]